MGQEISDSRFDPAAFEAFRHRLDIETALLGDWLAEGRLRSTRRRFGFEIEGWLLDEAGRPAACNRSFLDALDDELVVPELAMFNFEINSRPATLGPGALGDMHAALRSRWQRCGKAAARFALRPLLIGILPTVRGSDLTLRNISPLQRYRAINDQIFRLRGDRPILLDIQGEEHLQHEHPDVMLEAGTTSLQIHVEVDANEAARAFNICKMLSAVTVGAGANSPFLFGRRLWRETRIPLFEQAVAVGGSDYSNRVTFGIAYARQSILECFEANRRYPVLLPSVMDEPPERLAHLRLHNGTLWRWNRPLIGFDEQGRPHCRMEHRVVAAGPTPVDAIANTALFLGLFEGLMRSGDDLAPAMPFEVARENFYASARDGLGARIRWFDDRPRELGALLREQLLPLAVDGLTQAGLAAEEATEWLGPIRGRAERRMTGADWQVAWVGRHGRDFAALVDAYHELSADNRPVHEWPL